VPYLLADEFDSLALPMRAPHHLREYCSTALPLTEMMKSQPLGYQALFA